ncbi:MAG: hypothetical protein L0H27_08740, partial [Tetragenococcus halophilus]|nr:hypothetical protein [Tetragenococcus halophilus]
VAKQRKVTYNIILLELAGKYPLFLKMLFFGFLSIISLIRNKSRFISATALFFAIIVLNV